MISKSELNQLWSEIIPQGGQQVGRRADQTHPLDFFVTYDENLNLQFMLVSEEPMEIPKSSKQIIVRENQRSDGKYAICFSLVDNLLRDQYISLCWDIMDCTFEIHNKLVGGKSAIKRFVMWQKLFAEMKDKKLSDLEIKGLLGELYVLKNICIQRYGISKAIAGWIGPLGADRDFEYDDLWLEAKFISISKDFVEISSLDQLDTDKKGYLITVKGEKTSEIENGAVTINQLIEDTLLFAKSNEKDQVTFKNRLALCGLDFSDERIFHPYRIQTMDSFWVDDKFPRLLRSKAPVAITEASYKISLSGIQEWKQCIM